MAAVGEGGSGDELQQQNDELCVLRAIYGEEFVTALDGGDGAALSFAIPEATAQPHLVLRVHLPAAYPSAHPPVFELADSCGCLPADVLGGLAGELEGMFVPGEVVLYSWIERLRERWGALAPQQPGEGAEAVAAQDGDTAPAAALAAAQLADGGGGGDPQQQLAGQGRDAELEAALAQVAQSVVHGEPFTEKRSTFQAHLAPASSPRHVEALLELLLRSSKVRQATHNIMAYRIEQPDRPAFLQDYDDDGEQAAGGRLLHLLQMTDARNVCVVVSRWYGGILLGPARFTHINNVARELLDACGYIAAREGGGKGGKGRRR